MKTLAIMMVVGALIATAAGARAASADVRLPGTPTVNDLAFSHGFAYVTDSA